MRSKFWSDLFQIPYFSSTATHQTIPAYFLYVFARAGFKIQIELVLVCRSHQKVSSFACTLFLYSMTWFTQKHLRLLPTETWYSGWLFCIFSQVIIVCPLHFHWRGITLQVTEQNTDSHLCHETVCPAYHSNFQIHRLCVQQAEWDLHWKNACGALQHATAWDFAH